MNKSVRGTHGLRRALSFLFETIEGIGCLIVACLVLTTIIAAILEYRTRKTFKDRGEKDTDTEFFDEE